MIDLLAAALDLPEPDRATLRTWYERHNAPYFVQTIVKRGAVNATMDYLRQFADAGVAVVVVSAIGRTRDGKGRSTYAGEGLNLASFRESSELEFGCDDAYLLTPDDDDGEGDAVTLRHLKSRHGEALDLALTFDRKRQRFTPAVGQGADDTAKRSELAALWKRTAAATDGDEGSDDA